MNAPPATSVRNRLVDHGARRRSAASQDAAASPQLPGYLLGQPLPREGGGPGTIWTARDAADELVLVRRVNGVLARRLLPVPEHPGLLLPRALAESPSGTCAVSDAVPTAPLSALGPLVSSGTPSPHALLADAAEALAHLHRYGVVGRAGLPTSARLGRGGRLVIDVVAGVATDPLAPGWRAVATRRPTDAEADDDGAAVPAHPTGATTGERGDLEGLAALARVLLPEGAVLDDAVGRLLDRALLDPALLASTSPALPGSTATPPAPTATPPAPTVLATALEVAAAARAVARRAAASGAAPDQRLLRDLVAREERALILAGPQLGQVGARRRRAVRAVTALALGAVLGAGALVLSDEVSAAPATTTSATTTPASATRGGGPAATPLPPAENPARLREVFRQRDAALAATSPQALARAVVPGSAAWRFDAANLLTLREGGVVMSGLTTQVLPVRLGEGALTTDDRVGVVVRQSPHVRWRGGVPLQVPATSPRCLVVVLATDGRITDWGACG